MSRNLPVYGILVATAIALTGLTVHAEQSTAQPLPTVQAEGGDGLIWD